MKVSYDPDVDAVYLELLKSEPEGVIEVAEGIHIDVTSDGKIVGIELLDASKKSIPRQLVDLRNRCRWHRHARSCCCRLTNVEKKD